MQKRNYEVKVLINGSPVNEYWYDGKLYIEGREGTEFNLYIKNNGYERILAVPTVDGLSVMDGELAKYDSRGYIIDGYGSLTTKGWRVSDKEVAKFYFCDKKGSYATRSGNGDNQGIIGVAIFREKDNYNWIKSTTYTYPEKTPQTPWQDERIWLNNNVGGSTCSSSNIFLSTANCCQQQSDKPRSSIGTGWGDNAKSEVIKVNFERESSPDEVFTIYYGNRKDLKRWGIDVYNTPKPQYISAFPLENDGYCKPPRR